MYLIKTKRAIIRDVTIYEKDLTTTPTDDYDGFFSSREIRPTEYTYSALLFPNYDNTSDSYKYQLNKIERQHGGIYVNEDYVNESINTFLKKFIELEDFKKKSGLPEDIYNLAISDYLSKVSSEPYISMDEKIRANEERINKHFDE